MRGDVITLTKEVKIALVKMLQKGSTTVPEVQVLFPQAIAEQPIFGWDDDDDPEVDGE